MQKLADRLEFTTAQEPFHDFCLWEYKPIAPYEGKFRAVNLLFQSFDLTGMDERAFDLVRAIRGGFGASNTVCGIKQRDGEIVWEFYFYDYKRRERDRSVTRLLEIIRPLVRCRLEVNENLPYFMFSIDIGGDLVSGPGCLEEVHMYIGNPGSTVSSGICYSITNRGTRLENFYFFFDARREWDEIVAKAACSACMDATQVSIDRILWPELRTCRVIVIANKQQNDSVYFSGINVDQLIFFLNRMKYPRGLVSFVVENRPRLDHLLYDVGFDYRMEGSELRILKSGYYTFF
ncbi:MAG: hypothetical protein AB1512_02595 [Thermodesulfobacteriota bacterium]